MRGNPEKEPRCELHSDSDWNQLNDEQKLAKVLHHVIKINDAPAVNEKQATFNLWRSI